MGVGDQLHASAALPPEKNTSANFTGGWVAPMTGLEGVVKTKYLAPTGVRTPNRQVHNQSIYRLRYPGS
jgi:hypothetical protein